MIKKGDKVICIRIDFIDSNGNIGKLPFQIGKDYIVSHCGKLSIHVEGWAFSKLPIHVESLLKVQPDYIYLRKFEDYFITLAEFRDKRIDEILNDGK